MKHQTYPTDLTDRQWECIRKYIPAAKSGGRPRTLDMRSVINGILYIVVGGCQWRMMPTQYPKWKSIYHYFRMWRDDGTWQRIHDRVRADLRHKVGRDKQATAGCLDSQSVKATQVLGVRGYDTNKKVMGRKRHVVTDTLGLLLAVVVTSASVSDPRGARLVLGRLRGLGSGKRLRRIWVDGVYRGTLMKWVKEHFRFVLEPVLRSDDKKGVKGWVVLPRRWVIERTFAWLSYSRRLARDYEVLPKSSEAMIYIAMTRLMLRRLAK
ncbi:MAG: IS5 family transposase [Chloroflexota bacterium]